MASSEHEQLVAMIRAQRAAAGTGTGEAGAGGGVAMIRRFMQWGATFWSAPEDVTCTPVQAGDVQAEWIVAAGADPARALLYLHGGVYVGGSIATHRDLCARLSRSAGVRTLAVDYRLCPEHPLAAGLADALAAYRWLRAQGIDPAHIVFGGDSAGGGLVCRTLVALRDGGEPLPAAAFTLSAWTDLTASGDSYRSRRTTDVLFGTNGEARSGLTGDTSIESLLGELDLGAPEKSPLFAPLHGLPPLLMFVSDAEVVLDDTTRFAATVEGAGGDVTLEVWKDMIHIWPWFAALLPEGRDAIARIGAFIKDKTSTA